MCTSMWKMVSVFAVGPAAASRCPWLCFYSVCLSVSLSTPRFIRTSRLLEKLKSHSVCSSHRGPEPSSCRVRVHAPDPPWLPVTPSPRPLQPPLSRATRLAGKPHRAGAGLRGATRRVPSCSCCSLSQCHKGATAAPAIPATFQLGRMRKSKTGNRPKKAEVNRGTLLPLCRTGLKAPPPPAPPSAAPRWPEVPRTATPAREADRKVEENSGRPANPSK